MATSLISWLAMLIGSLLLDRTVQPRRECGWSWQGLLLHLLAMTAAFGLFLAFAGNALVAAVVTIALIALFTAMSNAKFKMLGEPLVFSDLALIAALIRHPRFYLTAISKRQRLLLAISAPILLLVLAALFVPRLAPHLLGFGVLVLATTALVASLNGSAFATLALSPDLDRDLVRHGLIATLLLYWRRWRDTPDPQLCPRLEMHSVAAGRPRHDTPDLIVIVQCESFADPGALTGDSQAVLAGLAHARASAWQWGDLGVSGFGAYTMRTEYGVLFGRSEAALAFRRYDPFLTAHGETSYALPGRLKGYGYRSLFVHPYDMRFYGRDRLMPAMGFDRLIGEESFASPPVHGGRYIDDQTLGSTMCDLVDEAVGPTLIYAVTMENHGPWDKDRLTGSPGGLDAYLRHLRSSDAMLTALIERLSNTGRSALLVFFGDHRPSIPGVVEPNGARHTPYVMLRFTEDGQIPNGANQRADLSPDELHHAILDCVRIPPAEHGDAK